MTTLTINGQSVNVDDGFLSLPPDKQEATVNEIAATLGKAKVAPQNRMQDVGADLGRAAIGGLVQGAAFVPDIANLTRSMANMAIDPLLGASAAQRAEADKAQFTFGSPEAKALAERTMGTKLDASAATTPEGKMLAPYVESAAKFAVPSVLTGGGLVGGGIIPGITSEAAGQAFKGTPNEEMARALGGMGGNLLGNLPSRVVTPFPATDARRLAQANALEAEGVPLTAGDRSGSMPLRWAESVAKDMPFSAARAAQLNMAQKEGYTGAAMRRVGENVTRAGPEEMQQVLQRFDQTFGGLAARHNMSVDPQFGTAVAAAQDAYHLTANPLQRQVIDDAVNGIINTIQRHNGVVPGDVYQAMRSRLGTAARSSGQDTQLRDAFYGLQHSLDDAMERSIQASGSPQDIAAWQEARNQYRNFIPVERAATGPGSETAQGFISPSQLRNAVTSQNRRAYGQGEGDLAELARNGEAILKPLPQSGTAPRSYWSDMIPGWGTARAALARVLLSGPVQGYLGNQVLGPGSPARERLVRGLLEVPVSNDRQ